MKSRLIMFFISIFAIAFIVSLSRSIYSLWQKGDVVSERVMALQKLQQENQRLKQELDEVESSEYIEKQAREKLNLQKVGEVVVVLPKNQPILNQPDSPSSSLPNWLQWYHLFF